MKFPERSFQLCGTLGLLCGGPPVLWLALRCSLSLWIELTIIVVAVGMLLATPLAVKVFTGRDGFVFYRDVICIFAGVTLTLRWLHQPVLPYLDITIVGAGMFHAWGRIGCLFSGCCYGRPSQIGIRYTHAHAEMGFPMPLIGVRLFPIQAMESAWILCLTLIAGFIVLRHASPGLAFVSYVAGYALGRFFFEFARGDAVRPYFAGFSHPQWISLLLVLSVSLAGKVLFPQFSLWLSSPVIVLALSALLIALTRKLVKTMRFELLHPSHMEQVAELVKVTRSPARSSGPRPSPGQRNIQVKQTSLGLRISAGEILHDGERLCHYALSKKGEPLSWKDASLLARQISLIQHDGSPFQSVYGKNGVFHLLFPICPLP